MAVTVHELLENAAKYSSGGGSNLRVVLDPTLPRALSVSVDNHADPRHLPGLRETIAELSSAPIPSTSISAICSAPRPAMRVRGWAWRASSSRPTWT